jgi:hypothetical protein
LEGESISRSIRGIEVPKIEDDAGPRSRGAKRPSYALIDPPENREGAGNAECFSRTHGPRAEKKHAAVTTGSAEITGIPCAMVLTVSFGLSPGTGLSCPRHRRIIIRRFDASVGASGPHDFAVRAGVARRFDTITSIASRSAFRDDRDAPLLPGRDKTQQTTDLGSKASQFLKIRSHMPRQIGTTGNLRMARMRAVSRDEVSAFVTRDLRCRPPR